MVGEIEDDFVRAKEGESVDVFVILTDNVELEESVDTIDTRGVVVNNILCD